MKKYNNRIFAHRHVALLLLLAVTMTMGACVKNVVHPPLDVTFLPQKGDFVSKYGDRLTMDEIIMMTKGKSYILLGEGHKNVNDHKVQQRMLSALAALEDGPVVGLEMVAVDMQPVLNDFAKGQVDVAGLEEELQWSTKWGYPYSLFSGLFDIVQRNSLPVAGLNVPTAITKKISKEGIESLSDEEKAYLPVEIVPPSSEQVQFLDMVYGQHAEKDPENATQRERFDLVQSIWDSKMAEGAVRLHQEYKWPVLVIAGSGHVEKGWGIAKRIRQFDPGAQILTIMPWRGGELDVDSGDVFFYSPETYESKMGATLTATGFGGLLVEGVKRGSRAEKAGLRPGDVLVESAGIPLDYLYSLHMAGSKVHELDEELIFTVRRGGETYIANTGKLGVAKSQGHPKDAKESISKPSESTQDQTKKEQ